MLRFTLKASQRLLRNSTTRIPFRYGQACLTSCPQAILQATVEVHGALHQGYSGDCLPPGWFDKSPDKDYAQQIRDMLAAVEVAQQVFGERAAEATTFFPAWLDSYRQVHRVGSQRGWEPLLTSFGLSLVERAVMDALARAAALSLHRAIVSDIFDLQPAAVHPPLRGQHPRDWLPPKPLHRIYVRHTVGLADPLTAADIPADQRIDDGLPQSLEDYVRRGGIRYFKIKLRNQADTDRRRLLDIAAILERYLGEDYSVTLDGNEQYRSAAQFAALLDELEGIPALATLLKNIRWIEQPMDRKAALNQEEMQSVRELSRRIPVIIDEADGTLEAFPRALEVGFRGVSFKDCKGPIKALLHAGLALYHSSQTRVPTVLTGEDLCTVGVVPVQSDLCMAAILGLEHVERNGHHYHRGLSYLPATAQRAALAAHEDFYTTCGQTVVPRLEDGVFRIGSLQCPGYGFAALPDVQDYVPAESWQYESLGLP